MKIRIFQKGFNYSQDGYGNRLVLHLQGCNMRCPWCSNPEGMSAEGELLTEKSWLYDDCCPYGAVREGRLNRRLCHTCKTKACVTGYRQKGLRMSCREYETEDIIRECIEAKPMYFENGGVTLTGGEIGVQFEAVQLLLQRLSEEGIHRTIESNASHPEMGEMIPYVDQWIMDVKHYDDAEHRKWTGVSNQWVLKNLEKVTQNHSDVLVRVPLIPGFNDRREDARKFAELFKEKIHGDSTKVEFLPYHELGKGKWEQCGRTYRMEPGMIAPGIREYFEDKMSEYGIRCIRT